MCIKSRQPLRISQINYNESKKILKTRPSTFKEGNREPLTLKRLIQRVLRIIILQALHKLKISQLPKGINKSPGLPPAARMDKAIRSKKLYLVDNAVGFPCTYPMVANKYGGKAILLLTKQGLVIQSNVCFTLSLDNGSLSAGLAL